MKSAVIYFSNTGNTKKIAQAIHKGMSQAADQSDIFTVHQADPVAIADYDLIGVGSPIWRTDLPANVPYFLEYGISSRLQGKHCFVFCTHGAIVGGAIRHATEMLTRKGLTVIGWNDWYGSVNLQYMAKPYYTDGHPDEIDLKEAEDWGREMVERSRRISRGETVLVPELPKDGSEWIEMHGPTYERIIHPPDEVEPPSLQFKINMDKCTECMLCVDNCPAHSIEFSPLPPVFKLSCIKCFLCELICPTGAIEVDFEAVHNSMHKYAKPNTQRQVEKEIAKGHFRPLIPFDKVGWDTPIYKITGHPRFKIT